MARLEDHLAYRTRLRRLIGGLVVAGCVALTASSVAASVIPVGASAVSTRPEPSLLGEWGQSRKQASSGREIERIETGAETPAPRTLYSCIPYIGRVRDRSAVAVREAPVELFDGKEEPDHHEFEPDNHSDEAWSLDPGSSRLRPHLDLSFAALRGGIAPDRAID